MKWSFSEDNLEDLVPSMKNSSFQVPVCLEFIPSSGFLVLLTSGMKPWTLAICAHPSLLSCVPGRLTSTDYITRLPPSGFHMDLANGQHQWERGGQEERQAEASLFLCPWHTVTVLPCRMAYQRAQDGCSQGRQPMSKKAAC
ncbi:PREDICTED: uncharacterized protein LOC105531401 isoform X1 [Mandrillus leucophaeus]|uniref:uncharacterized protein LOC105531401 isoform X1 n=1 Tax=Mandrillus leucophaeus TaxID=9568 RepID=UPI0005F42273|nr:PREDICTED: uncharacterized protein LOC105531401 isoform X1 [Mandrillus leucophaeus]